MIIDFYKGYGGGGSGSGATEGYWNSAQTKTYVDSADTIVFDSAVTYTDTAVEGLVNSGDVKSQIEEYGYATEQYVQDAISGVDLSNYWDSAATQEAINQSVEGLVNSGDVKDQIEAYEYVNSGDVKSQVEAYGYATEQYVQDAVSAITIPDGNILKAVSEFNSAATEGDIQSLLTTTSGLPEGFSLVEHMGLGEEEDRTGATLTVDFYAASGYTEANPLQLFTFDAEGVHYEVFATENEWHSEGIYLYIAEDGNLVGASVVNMGIGSDDAGYWPTDDYEINYHETQAGDANMVIDIYNADGEPELVFEIPESTVFQGLYAKVNDEHVKFATEQYVQDALSGANPDLSAYWTSAETQSAIEAAGSAYTSVADFSVLSSKVQANEIVTVEALNELHDDVLALSGAGFATEEYVQGALSAVDLSDFYTKDETDSAFTLVDERVSSVEQVAASSLTELHSLIFEVSGSASANSEAIDSRISMVEMITASALTDLHTSVVSHRVSEITAYPDAEDYPTCEAVMSYVSANAPKPIRVLGEPDSSVTYQYQLDAFGFYDYEFQAAANGLRTGVMVNSTPVKFYPILYASFTDNWNYTLKYGNLEITNVSGTITVTEQN